MKIGLFTDSHYSSAALTCGNRFNNQSLRKIAEAMTVFAQEKCDMVIVLGDITDTETEPELEKQNLRQIAKILDSSKLDVFCLMGNHDAFVFTPDEFYELLGEKFRPRTLRRNGTNLIFLDACYFHTGVHYAPGDSDWTDTFYPHTAELENTLSSLTGDIYVFMHQNIDPEIRADHCLSNAAQIRSILENAGNVKAVYQGHYHLGHETIRNDISYVTLPAMCQSEGAYRIVHLPESTLETHV